MSTIRGFVKDSLRGFYVQLKQRLSNVAFSGNYSDLSGKPTLDSAPTENSANAVTSGGVYTALNNAVALPSVSASDNGKILQVVNGTWTLVTPPTIYTGSGTPDNSLGNNGDIYIQS